MFACACMCVCVCIRACVHACMLTSTGVGGVGWECECVWAGVWDYGCWCSYWRRAGTNLSFSSLRTGLGLFH